MEQNCTGKEASGQKTPPQATQGSLHNCSGCGKPIVEKYLFNINQEYWHEGCLKCCICRSSLRESCYSKNNKLLCKADYRRLYGAKCATCKQAIAANELVMRAVSNLYHLHCFKCDECGKVLEKGDEFLLKEDRLFCKDDFNHARGDPDSSAESIKEEEPGSPASSDVSSFDDRRSNTKRPRTILTSSQRKAFKASFELSPKPCRKVREELSRETGLSVRVVQVWFQNQRAKLKKMAKKNSPNNGEDCIERKGKGSKKRSRHRGNCDENQIMKDNLQDSKDDQSPSDNITLPPPSPGQLSGYDGMLNISQYNVPPPNLQPFYPTTQSLQGGYQSSIPPPPYHDYSVENSVIETSLSGAGHYPSHLSGAPYQDSPLDIGGQNHLQLMHHMLNSF